MSLKIISRVNDGVYGEYYTPQRFLQSVYEVLGSVDLDPASNEGIPNVEAKRYYTRNDDGLSLPWNARTVFVNPVYGKRISKWTQKMIAEYRAGHFEEGILLVPMKGETKWAQRLVFPFCQVEKRILFETPYGKLKRTTQLFGSAFYYFGNDLERFAYVFKKHGLIRVPYVFEK